MRAIYFLKATQSGYHTPPGQDERMVSSVAFVDADGNAYETLAEAVALGRPYGSIVDASDGADLRSGEMPDWNHTPIDGYGYQVGPVRRARALARP